MHRRNLLKGLVATGLVPHESSGASAAWPEPDRVQPPEMEPFSVHVFSKNLHFLHYEELAAAASDLGFDGVDLTVRPDGHVEPARVRTDLPKAVEALKKRNLSAAMMTTAIMAVTEPDSKAILETASQQGIRSYRMGWLPYPAQKSIPETLNQYQRQLAELAQLNQQYKLRGAYQNHAGTSLGSAVWDLGDVLQAVRSPYMGCQYDIRHATVEGGTAWPVGLRYIHPHIQSLAIKDFIWEKVNGRWQAESVPLGQGMVDFGAYLALVKQLNIRVPISLHFEYPLGGADQGKRDITIPREKVYTAMRTDLQTLKTMLKGAGLTS